VLFYLLWKIEKSLLDLEEGSS